MNRAVPEQARRLAHDAELASELNDALRRLEHAAERWRQLATETGELAGELMTTLVGAGWSEQNARDANIGSLIWPEVDQ